MEELAANLDGYMEQLQQVNELLLAEPENEEYKEMASELKEVIGLTEELLATARQNESSDFGAVAQVQTPDAEKLPASAALPRVNFVSSQLNSTQSTDVVIANTQDRDQLSGRLPVGTRVQAVWSGDGEWYDGVIDAITDLGYQISYTSWGNSEEVEPANVRPVIEEEIQEDEMEEPLHEDTLVNAEQEAEAAKQAIKRKLAEAADHDLLPRDLPNKLKIKPDDPEDVKAVKRKKIHAFKSKQRLEVMEVAQNQRQHAWQQFQTKGKQKKVGFFTGRKKESIFKSPVDIKGKVGVTGSGHGMTDFQRREKYVPARGEEGDE